MPKEPKSVLIGDANRARFDLLDGILKDKFAASAIHAKTFEELKAKARDLEWSRLLVAEDLPYSESNRASLPGNYLLYLSAAAPGKIIAPITSKAEPGTFPLHTASAGHVHIPAPSCTPQDREKIALHLQLALGLEPLHPRSLERPTAHPEQVQPRVAPGNLPLYTGTKQPQALPAIQLEDSLALRLLVQSLGTDGSLEKGKKQLARLIQRFAFRGSKFEIRDVGQGLSGASVFRVVPSKESRVVGGFALKVIPQAQKEKMRREVHQYLTASPGLRIGVYSSYVPAIKSPAYPCDNADPDLKYVVEDGEWLALCHDFLGGEVIGNVVDLETALTAGSRDLAEMTEGRPLRLSSDSAAAVREFRRQVLEVMLTFLCKVWYANPHRVRRRVRPLWKTQDVPDNKPMSVPPYRLWRRRRDWILRFLASRDTQIGKVLFPSWRNIHEAVAEFVENSGGKTHIRLLDQKMPVLLSPSHGDLNANNIFLWLEDPAHLFLIDFPFYQQSGHAMQDFARLEVEIKFAIMDRQGNTPTEEVPALDITPSQVPIWQGMEDHLLSETWKDAKQSWPERGYTKNAEQCLQWVQMVREKAERVQRQGLQPDDPPKFLEEYFPALLFHTLQVIAWPSLSILKRLLAVYSAASILERLKQLG